MYGPDFAAQGFDSSEWMSMSLLSLQFSFRVGFFSVNAYSRILLQIYKKATKSFCVAAKKFLHFLFLAIFFYIPPPGG